MEYGIISLYQVKQILLFRERYAEIEIMQKMKGFVRDERKYGI